jgi:hypothetical protein
MKKNKHDKTVRFSTLIKLCGLPAYCDQLCGATWERVTRKWLPSDFRRVLTIHHGDGANARFWAEPGKQCVNVVGFCVFAKPIPPGIGYVIGVEHRMGDLKQWKEVLR